MCESKSGKTRLPGNKQRQSRGWIRQPVNYLNPHASAEKKEFPAQIDEEDKDCYSQTTTLKARVSRDSGSRLLCTKDSHITLYFETSPRALRFPLFHNRTLT